MSKPNQSRQKVQMTSPSSMPALNEACGSISSSETPKFAVPRVCGVRLDF